MHEGEASSSRNMPLPGSGWRASLRDAARLGAVALRPAAAVAELGRAAELRARRAASRRVLGALDAVLASSLAEEAVDRITASPLIERAAGRALRGPLVEAVARDLARYAVIERATEQLLVDDELDRLVGAAIDSPHVERLADRVLESPGAERLVARVIESRLLDEAVDRLLESEELWVLVDEVARSPAVTDAISKQGIGFADQIAGVVRDRSRNADDRLEHVARRMIRRRAGEPAPPAEDRP